MPMRAGQFAIGRSSAAAFDRGRPSMTLASSLRILDLCEFFSDRGCGVRSYLEKMGKAAEKAGPALTVLAPGKAHQVSRHSGMKLVRYCAPPMPYDATYRVPWRLDLMRRLVAEERPDI